MIRIMLVAALACLVSVARAQKAESTLAEAKVAFAKADRALNDAWAAFRKTLPADVLAIAKEKQREWLEFRNKQALAASGQSNEDEAKRSPSYFTTAATLTETRAAWFHQRAVRRDETMTGYWHDGNGGGIDIVQQEGQLLFSLNVGRTHGAPERGNTNLGSLAGIAAWNESIGWFSDKGREPEKADETNLSFILRDQQRLEIVEANARYYQGKAASFDGIYYKIAPLGEDEQRKVIQAAKSGHEESD